VNHVTTTKLAALVALVAATAAACAPQASEPSRPAIASVHRTQCARCHRLPEPGLHPRDYLENALGPHHRRVHLTDQEWAQLVDYLAASPNPG
jgi:hypothetical protein